MNIEFFGRTALISDYSPMEEEFLKSHLSWGSLSYRIPLEVVPYGIIPVTEKSDIARSNSKVKKVTLMLAKVPDGRLYTLKYALIYVLKKFGEEIGFDISSLPEEEPDRLGKIDPEYLKGIRFRDYQEKTINKALAFGSGIIMSAVGSGKTEMQIAISSYILEKNISEYVLIVCPSIALVDNFCSRCLKYEITDFQRFTSGSILNEDKHIIVANIDSVRNQFSRRGVFVYLLKKCQTVIFDEAHHLRADTFYQVVVTVNPEHLFEFSGTPFQNNNYYSTYEDFLVYALGGRIVASVSSSYLIEQGYLARPYYLMLPVGKHHRMFEKSFVTVYSKYIVKSKERNKLITEWAKFLVQYKMKTLILVQRLEHMDILLTSLHEEVPEANVIGIKGNSEGRSYDCNSKGIIEFPVSYDSVFERFYNNEFDIIIATQIADEGVDLPSCDCVLLACGQRSHIKTTQRIGRGLRRKSGVNETYIIDFMDNSHPYLRKHSNLRKNHYQSIGAVELDAQQFVNRVYENHLAMRKENE